MIKTYVEKPKEIKAIQYKGFDSLSCIQNFMGSYFEQVLFRPFSERLIISESEREVKVGDYIVKDDVKLFYSMPREVFETYYDIKN